MPKQIYFSLEELNRGNFFELHEVLAADEGQHYELEEWLGRGGNAAVYRCRNSVTGDEYAVKFLMHTGDRNQKRFAREADLLKQFQNEHIVRYTGSGTANVRHILRRQRGASRVAQGLPFLVMELAKCNLQDVMKQERVPIPYERYSGQFRGLSRALAALHDIAIHRDIKPENILVSGERWMLSDYGLCSFVSPVDEEDLTPEGQNVGPKYWLSPEAHNMRLGCADQITKASDVFQLAAVFWYVATGRHPSGIVTQSDWSGPSGLFDLLQRSLLHDLKKRPKDGAEFVAELDAALIS